MAEKEKVPEETQLVKIEEMSLEEVQIAEQLYNSAGLDPVVDAGLKDYDKRIQQENKLLSKVLGARGSDIRGYSGCFSLVANIGMTGYSWHNK